MGLGFNTLFDTIFHDERNYNSYVHDAVFRLSLGYCYPCINFFTWVRHNWKTIDKSFLCAICASYNMEFFDHLGGDGGAHDSRGIKARST